MRHGETESEKRQRETEKSNRNREWERWREETEMWNMGRNGNGAEARRGGAEDGSHLKRSGEGPCRKRWADGR